MIHHKTIGPKKKPYIQYVSYYLKLLKIIELCKSHEYIGGHSNFLFSSWSSFDN